jgi:hypothetical protein
LNGDTSAFLGAPSERDKVDEMDHEPPGERDMPGGILSFQNQPPRHGTWKKSASGASGGKNAVVKLVSPLVVGFAVH